MQAVVVNAGIANACTGAEGFGYCKDTAKKAAGAAYFDTWQWFNLSNT